MAEKRTATKKAPAKKPTRRKAASNGQGPDISSMVRSLPMRLVLGGGGYNGARVDLAALKEWDPRLDSPDTATIPALQRLRSRSRDLVRNDPLAESSISAFVSNAVGAGLIPLPMPDAEYLGITEDEATAWAQKALRIYWHWAGSRACDLARAMSHNAQQSLTLRSQLLSGDVLVLRRFRPRPGDLLGLKLQFIEADRISTPPEKVNDPKVIDGVEIDADGAPVAYWVQNEHPGDRTVGKGTWARILAEDATGDRQALHLYTLQRPGQTRGVPMLAPVIEHLKQRLRYTVAELMAAVVNGMIVYSIESEAGEEVPRLASQTVGEVETDQADGQVKVDYGAIIGLGQGETLNMHAPTRPSAGFDPFMLTMAREIGAGVGLPASVILHHFNKSYSAGRAEWMLAWKHFTTRRDFIAWEFCQPVYGWLISEAIARGLLEAPGFFADPLVREAWLGCEWRGAPPGQLDPLKEIQAVEKRRALRISTLAQETAETTGGDWQANLRQLAREKALAESLGLGTGGDAPAPDAPPPPDEDEDDATDEDDEV